MTSIDDIARRTIPQPEGKETVLKEDGDTSDIIKAVLAGIKKDRGSLDAFVRQLRRTHVERLSFDPKRFCAELWAWVKARINYLEDPGGRQRVKSPAALYDTRHGDCKSMTVFVATVLHAAGIDHFIRFAAYQPGPVTHVYAVARIDGKEVPVDTVWKAFGAEKNYRTKKDYPMTKISRVSGADEDKILDLPADLDLTDAEMQLHIAKANKIARMSRVVAVNGIGRASDRYGAEIDAIDDLIAHARNSRALDQVGALIEQGEYAAVAGIGAAQRAERRKRRDDKIQAGGQKPRGGKARELVEKVKAAGGKALKVAAKVATAPQRLAAKGLLEVTLPKAAPYFLYLFVNDPKLIGMLPEAARSKRKKSEAVANFVVEGIGMKRAHFMGIVRAGIIKQLGKDPEKVIAAQLQGKVAGIGAVLAVIQFVIELIQKVAKLVGKKGPDVEEKDAPAGSDMATATAEVRKGLAGGVLAQPAGDNYDSADDSKGKGFRC